MKIQLIQNNERSKLLFHSPQTSVKTFNRASSSGGFTNTDNSASNVYTGDPSQSYITSTVDPDNADKDNLIKTFGAFVLLAIAGGIVAFTKNPISNHFRKNSEGNSQLRPDKNETQNKINVDPLRQKSENELETPSGTGESEEEQETKPPVNPLNPQPENTVGEDSPLGNGFGVENNNNDTSATEVESTNSEDLKSEDLEISQSQFVQEFQKDVEAITLPSDIELKDQDINVVYYQYHPGRVKGWGKGNSAPEDNDDFLDVRISNLYRPSKLELIDILDKQKKEFTLREGNVIYKIIPTNHSDTFLVGINQCIYDGNRPGFRTVSLIIKGENKAKKVAIALSNSIAYDGDDDSFKDNKNLFLQTLSEALNKFNWRSSSNTIVVPSGQGNPKILAALGINSNIDTSEKSAPEITPQNDAHSTPNEHLNNSPLVRELPQSNEIVQIPENLKIDSNQKINIVYYFFNLGRVKNGLGGAAYGTEEQNDPVVFASGVNVYYVNSKFAGLKRLSPSALSNNGITEGIVGYQIYPTNKSNTYYIRINQEVYDGGNRPGRRTIVALVEGEALAKEVATSLSNAIAFTVGNDPFIDSKTSFTNRIKETLESFGWTAPR
ncbi:MAG: hypothetical protein QNJ31_02505 [Candidatus Caenarcaniphilales bacterium]|nr:hypothetical protein [Candidatus Caenarcaniphilales bacterium]